MRSAYGCMPKEMLFCGIFAQFQRSHSFVQAQLREETKQARKVVAALDGQTIALQVRNAWSVPMLAAQRTVICRRC